MVLNYTEFTTERNGGIQLCAVVPFWVYDWGQCRNNKEHDFDYWKAYGCACIGCNVANFLKKKFQSFHNYFLYLKTD